ncbi:MAG: hypothetical protein U9Q07_01365, partial [Planctomycetota bacterium]|nr:hypothetical protein [Planctomycetota bacterium]
MSGKMNTRNSDCILLFVKSPMAGQVKTRLAAEIGDDAAVGLYRPAARQASDLRDPRLQNSVLG